MYSIIVVPPPTTEDRTTPQQLRLAPGERLTFGRAAACAVRIPHEGVSRGAGEITAQGAFWALSHLSGRQTYVVENPEGAGEHIKVGPGRLEAPVPFEFSRIALPAAGRPDRHRRVGAAPRLSAPRRRHRGDDHRARRHRARTAPPARRVHPGDGPLPAGPPTGR
ncbi:hypothetical protein QF027_005994 [Streptomyces canus]|nr:hypothetical protein [Streptomyces canus]